MSKTDFRRFCPPFHIKSEYMSDVLKRYWQGKNETFGIDRMSEIKGILSPDYADFPKGSFFLRNRPAPQPGTGPGSCMNKDRPDCPRRNEKKGKHLKIPEKDIMKNISFFISAPVTEFAFFMFETLLWSAERCLSIRHNSSVITWNAMQKSARKTKPSSIGMRSIPPFDGPIRHSIKRRSPLPGI